MSFWRAGAGGVTVAVKVHPRARRSGVLGLQDSMSGSRLKIAVTEPAEDGKANEAVCALLANALHCPASAIRIISGGTHREKSIRIIGDAVALVARLQAL